MHASELIRRLRERYLAPEWVFLEEVHDATGMRARRRFDAVALRCYPSGVGLVRLGFEVKVSRGDFSRELEQHDKRAALEKLCHEVYFVVAPDVCEPREIPEPWGLLLASGEGVKTVRKAGHRKVGPLGDDFAISIIRQANERAEQRFSRKLRLNGDEVTDEVVKAYVDEQMERERERLATCLEAARRDREAAQAVLQHTDRWAAIFDTLREHAGLRRPPADPRTPPTFEQLNETMAAIRGRVLADIRGGLRGLGETVQRALAAVDALPKDVALGRVPLPDDVMLDKLAMVLLEHVQGPRKVPWVMLTDRAKDLWRQKAALVMEACRS